MKKINLILLLSFLSCSLFAQHTISGQINCLAGATMNEVTVELTGPGIGTLSTLTDSDGNYSFNDIPAGEDYTIHAEKDGAILNGVSTYDLVLIMQKVFDPTFDDPFLFLAADINLSGAVTTLDLLLLRQLILFQTTTVPGGTWRFATEDFGIDPPSGSVNDVLVIDLQEDLVVSLIGVKVGDMQQAQTGSCE